MIVSPAISAITPHAGDRARYDARLQLKMASCRVYHRVEGSLKIIPRIGFIARRRNRRVLLTMARGSNGPHSPQTATEGGKMDMRRAAPFSMASSPWDVSDRYDYLKDKIKTHEATH